MILTQQLAKITGIVLSGRLGSRMGGKDKGLALLNDIALFGYVLETLRPQVNQLVISANRHIDIYQQAGVPVIADSLPECWQCMKMQKTPAFRLGLLLN